MNSPSRSSEGGNDIDTTQGTENLLSDGEADDHNNGYSDGSFERITQNDVVATGDEGGEAESIDKDDVPQEDVSAELIDTSDVPQDVMAEDSNDNVVVPNVGPFKRQPLLYEKHNNFYEARRPLVEALYGSMNERTISYQYKFEVRETFLKLSTADYRLRITDHGRYMEKTDYGVANEAVFAFSIQCGQHIISLIEDEACLCPTAPEELAKRRVPQKFIRDYIELLFKSCGICCEYSPHSAEEQKKPYFYSMDHRLVVTTTTFILDYFYLCVKKCCYLVDESKKLLYCNKCREVLPMDTRDEHNNKCWEYWDIYYFLRF